MPPLTPSRIRLMRRLCLAACSIRAAAATADRVRPATRRLAASACSRSVILPSAISSRDMRQVVLRARADERRRELVEGALAELVVVVVDLPRALGGDDHERVARVHLVEQLVDAGMNHRARPSVAAGGELPLDERRRTRRRRARGRRSRPRGRTGRRAPLLGGERDPVARSRPRSRSRARAAGARAPRAARRRRSSTRAGHRAP